MGYTCSMLYVLGNNNISSTSGICYEVLPLNAKNSTAVVNQSDPERDESENRDILKSYTPQIRYTKLDFKVNFLYLFQFLVLA